MVGFQKKEGDVDLKRRVVNFLAGRHLPALKRLDVSVEGGVVTLRGRVKTFYEKQVGQQCCRRVAGVLNLIDEIDVEIEDQVQVEETVGCN